MGFNATQFYEFGKKRGFAPNVFIGGVASTINTPALLASRLRNFPSNSAFSASNIQSFTIVGNNIQCYIGVDWTTILMRDVNPTYFIDIHQRCKQYEDSFGNTLLTIFDAKGILKLNDYTFYATQNLREIILPNCTEIANFSTTFYNTFYNTFSLERLYLPNCMHYGNTYLSTNQLFVGMRLGCIIYVHPSMATINNGAMEGDLLWAQTNRGAIIRYVTNFTAPNPITTLAVQTVYSDGLKMTFTAPTGSTNAIDYYEVFVDGVFIRNVTTTTFFVTGLTLGNTYTITIKAVDVFFNKSEISNAVVRLVNGVDSLMGVISYYQFENNLLDSVGTNHGTGTAITYATGQVGQAGVFNGTNSNVKAQSSNFDIFGTQNFSMVALINLSALPTGSNQFGIVAIQEATQPLTVDKSIRITSTGQVIFYGFDGAVRNAITSTGEIAINTNYIIVGTYDGINLRVYINGVLKATLAASGTFNFTNPTLAISHIASPQVATNGRIDEVAIFNKALTQTDVSNIHTKFQAGLPLF